MENDELQRYIRILNGKYSEEQTGEMTKQSTNKIGKYTNPIIKIKRKRVKLLGDILLLCGLF